MIADISTATEPVVPVAARRKWGDINGESPKFSLYVDDILAALFHLRAGTHERKLVHYVLHWSWTAVTKRGRKGGRFGDPLSCYLDIPALAEAWGVSRTRLANDLSALLNDRIIVPLGPGYTVNKDVEDWPEHRIDRASVAFARDILKAGPIGQQSPSRHRPSSQIGDETGRGFATNFRIRRESATVRSACDTNSSQIGDERSRIRDEELVAYRNAGASEEFKKIEEEKHAESGRANSRENNPDFVLESPTDRTLTRAAGTSGLKAPNLIPPGPAATASENVISTNASTMPVSASSGSSPRPLRDLGAPGSESPEAERLSNWARQHGGEWLAFFAKSNCDEVPAVWIEALIRRKVIGQPVMDERRALGLLGKIVSDWIAAGECEYLKRQTPAFPRLVGGFPVVDEDLKRRRREASERACEKIRAQDRAIQQQREACRAGA